MLHHFPQDLNVSEDTFRYAVTQYARESGSLLLLHVCSSGCKHIWSPTTLQTWLGQSEVGGIFLSRARARSLSLSLLSSRQRAVSTALVPDLRF